MIKHTIEGAGVGIFSKKPKATVCEMCGKSDVEGCGSADRHVVTITADEPSWLPANYRAQAQNEFTWLCTRCNSYPAAKWPREGGASAGMMMHLGSEHHVGIMKNSPVPGDQMIRVQ